MKKIISLLICILLIFLCACNKKDFSKIENYSSIAEIETEKEIFYNDIPSRFGTDMKFDTCGSDCCLDDSNMHSEQLFHLLNAVEYYEDIIDELNIPLYSDLNKYKFYYGYTCDDENTYHEDWYCEKFDRTKGFGIYDAINYTACANCINNDIYTPHVFFNIHKRVLHSTKYCPILWDDYWGVEYSKINASLLKTSYNKGLENGCTLCPLCDFSFFNYHTNKTTETVSTDKETSKLKELQKRVKNGEKNISTSDFNNRPYFLK